MSFDVGEWRTRMLDAVSAYGTASMEHAWSVSSGTSEAAAAARMDRYQRILELVHEVPFHPPEGGA